MLCVDNDEGAMKVLGSSLAGIVHAFVHSSLRLWHVTDTNFPLKFTDRLKRSSANHYRQSDIVFDFKTARMYPTGSITRQ